MTIRDMLNEILEILIVTLQMIAAILLVVLLVSTCAHAKPCLTHAEARAKWPDQWLYWHTERKCWDRIRGSHRDDFDEAPKPKSEKLAAEIAPKPVLSKPIEPAKAEPVIVFPLVEYNKANILQQLPLMLPQPWLSPDYMHNWPLLLDIDRTPFKAWDKRIGVEP